MEPGRDTEAAVGPARAAYLYRASNSAIGFLSDSEATVAGKENKYVKKDQVFPALIFFFFFSG